MSDRSTNADQLLPLRLQDFCLLKVINDLTGYQVELLASLPHWLRYRLLVNITAFDLCRLDNTSIARGIDTNRLWDIHLKLYEKQERNKHMNQTKSSFHLDLNSYRAYYPAHTQSNCMFLEEELKSAFQDLKREAHSAREKFLAKILSNVLSDANVFNSRLHITSIQGSHVLQHLLHCKSISQRLSHEVWKKQETALLTEHHSPSHVHPLFRSYCETKSSVLTPHRLASIFDEKDTLWLFSFLVNDCRAQPVSVSLHINRFSQQIQHAIYTGRIAQDNGLKMSSQSNKFLSSMNALFRKVEIMKVQCDNYVNVGDVVSMIEAATSGGNDSKLKHLFCVLPDLYYDIVQPISTILALKNFQHLFLDLDDVHLLNLGRLLHCFMVAPCSHVQKLTINVKRIQPSNTFDVAQLGTLKRGKVTVPQCAIEHKLLPLQSSSTTVLCVLLQLPTIRLNELCLNGIDYGYIHLCAQHPDLLMAKLIIKVLEHAWEEAQCTAQEDFVSLLKKPTLQEISISGYWGHNKEVRIGLTQGFRERAQIPGLPPLVRISLDETSDGFSTEDIHSLWDAIFSLPALEQLEVDLGAGFRDVQVIYDSWIATAAKAKLKLIHISGRVPDSSLLSHLAQRYSFQSKHPKLIQQAFLMH